MNETRSSLARISLRWMIHECFRTRTGIQFYQSALEDLGIDVGARTPDSQRVLQPSAATGQQCAPTTNGNSNPTEGPSLATIEEEECADALSQMHDQLEMVKAWWILEWLPLRHRRQYNHYSRPRHYLLCVSTELDLGVYRSLCFISRQSEYEPAVRNLETHGLWFQAS